MMRFQIAVISLLSLLPATPGRAEEEPRNACHRIPEASARLGCYDLATGYKPPAGRGAAADPAMMQVAPEASGASAAGQGWIEETEVSALDGRKDVWLSLQSVNTIEDDDGKEARATLYLRCMGNQTNAFVEFNSYTTENQDVKIKLDDDKLRMVRMEAMNAGEGIGIWSGSKAISFIKSLYGKEKMVVAYRSQRNLRLEFSFNIAGVKTRLATLSQSCGWKA